MWVILQLVLLVQLLQLCSCTEVLNRNLSLLLMPQQATNENSLLAFTIATIRLNNELIAFIADPTSHETGVVYACKLRPDDIVLGDGPRLMKMCNRTIDFNFRNKSEPEVSYDVLKFGFTIATLNEAGFVICAPGYNKKIVTNFTIISAPGLCGYWRDLSATPQWHTDFFINIPSTFDEKDKATCLGGHAAALSRGYDGVLQLGVSGPFCTGPNLAIRNMVPRARNLITMNGAAPYTGFSLMPTGNRFYTVHPIWTLRSPLYTKFGTDDSVENTMARGNFDALRRKSFSYIGYSSTLLNKGNRRAFLLLGAPFQAELNNGSKTDVGCVFLMNTNGQGAADPPHFCGTNQTERLGMAITKLNDLNGDGLNDFAIGCPGCGEHGIVYLFITASSYFYQKLVPTYTLRGEEISPDIRGFGFSLTAGDVNNDTLDDLFIGAMPSGHVTVMATSALADVSIRAVGQSLVSPLVMVRSDVITVDYQLQLTFPKQYHGRSMSVAISFKEFTETRPRFLIYCTSDGDEDCMYNLTTTDRKVFFNHLLLEVRSDLGANMASLNMFDPVLVQATIGIAGKRDDIIFNIDGRPCGDGDCNTTFKALGFSGLGRDSSSDLQLNFVEFKGREVQVELENQAQVTVQLQVKKPTERFFGGVGLHLQKSDAIAVSSDVTSSLDRSLIYYTDSAMISITNPISCGEDVMTKKGTSTFYINVTVIVRDLSRPNKIKFNLVPLSTGIHLENKFASLDPDLSNNDLSLNIELKSVLALQLHIKEAASTIADLRPSSKEAELKRLSGLVSGSTIGPELQEVFLLTGFSKPARPVEKVSLNVRLPLATGDDLLLYFPRTMRFGAAGEIQVPGLPYLSKFINGTFIEEDELSSRCQPVEKELAKLLHSPDLQLLEARRKEQQMRKPAASMYDVSKRRVRRSTSDQPELSMAGSSGYSANLRYIDLLDCDRSDLAPFPLRCITFQCEIDLPTRTSGLQSRTKDVYLHIHSRLWSPTYFKYGLGILNLTTRIDLLHKPNSMYKIVEIAGNTNATQTFLFKGIELKPEDFPWGFVVLGIFIGIWLLLLLILLLWYCNFFQRKRHHYRPVSQEKPEDDSFYH